MKRRSFLKMLGLSAGTIAGASYAPGGKDMSRLGDILARLAEGRDLSRSEINTLRFEGNNMHQMGAAVRGLLTAGGNLDLSFLPIRVLYSKRLSHDTPSIEIRIPSDMNNLLCFGSTRSDAEAWGDPIKCILNDDTGNNYEYELLWASEDNVFAGQNRAYAQLLFGGQVAASQAANFCGTWFAVMPNIHSALFKGSLVLAGGRESETTNGASLAASWWENTSPIRKITLTPENGTNFLAGSSFSILGIV